MSNVVGKAVRHIGTEGLAKFQRCERGEDTTLRKKSHYHGIDFLEASCEGGDSDTSVTVRPISVEEKVEESDEEEFEEDVEVEKMGEEAERFEAEDEGNISGSLTTRDYRVKRKQRNIVSVGMWSIGTGVTCA